LWTFGDFPLPVKVDARHYVSFKEEFASKKARMCLDALEEGHNQVIFCGADTELFAPLPNMSFFNIGIVPHLCRPLPLDGNMPSANIFNYAGHCNADFIAMNNTPETKAALEWLDSCCQYACKIDPCNGCYNEQSWLSLMPCLFNGVVMWRTMTVNVAYWNCYLYNLRKENGVYVTDGGALCLFHYSGFDPAKPEQMSNYQTRYIASGDILELYQSYATRLLKGV
jgi:hypothetical protein